jgi:hypothetical protein
MDGTFQGTQRLFGRFPNPPLNGKVVAMRKAIVIAAFASLAFVANADAAPIIFSGFDNGANSTDPRPNSNAAQGSFSLAVGSSNLITFESSPLGSFSSLTVAPGVVMSGNGEIRNSASGTPDRLFGYNTTSAGSRFVSMLGGDLTFTFASPISAFGAYFSGIQSQASQETITFSDGSSQTVNIPNTSMPDGGVAFVGFTDAGKQISSVQIHFTNDIVGLDDVQFANVPEPTSLAVFALIGIASALGGLRRKNRS